MSGAACVRCLCRPAPHHAACARCARCEGRREGHLEGAALVKRRRQPRLARGAHRWQHGLLEVCLGRRFGIGSAAAAWQEGGAEQLRDVSLSRVVAACGVCRRAAAPHPIHTPAFPAASTARSVHTLCPRLPPSQGHIRRRLRSEVGEVRRAWLGHTALVHVGERESQKLGALAISDELRNWA